MWLLSAAAERAPPADAAHHRRRAVQDRDQHQRDRHQQSVQGGGAADFDQWQDGEHETEQVTPRVAHDDRRGRPVGQQEPEQRPEQRHGQDRGEHVTLEQGDDRHSRRGEGRDTAGEPIHPVDHVHGVGHAHDPQHGERHRRDPELEAAEQGQRDRPDLDAAHGDDERGDDLQQELGAGAQRREVVVQTDGKDQHHAAGRGQQRCHRQRQRGAEHRQQQQPGGGRERQR